MTEGVPIEAERVEDLALSGHALLAVDFVEHGRPTALYTDDAHARVAAPTWGERPFHVRPYPATVVTAAGRRVDLGTIDHRSPMVVGLPEGEVLVVQYRCRPDDHNAVVFGPDGDRRRTFALGDAARHVQTDPSGAIWAGYSDEGIFSGSDGIGTGALVRFGPEGAIDFRYAEGDHWMGHCYAVNATDGSTWAFTDRDDVGPLLRVDREDGRRTWTAPFAGSGAIAVAGDRILAFGRMLVPWSVEDWAVERLTTIVATIGGDEVTIDRITTIVDDHGQQLAPDHRRRGQVVGRGRFLHLVVGTVWWRVDAATF